MPMPKIRSLSWTPLLLALTLAASALGNPAAAAESGTAVEAGWILQKIARPVPARTPFVEVRTSPMLKAPLRIAGEYRRPDADTLVREVRTPYAETTTIAGGRASIARDGRSARTFSLSRAPELASLQQGFGSLLAGDRTTVEQHYRLKPSGTRERWSLLMTPKDPELAKRVRDITLYGQGAELRCIETAPATGTALQRTLLAGGARDAAQARTEQALAALCRSGIAR
jgi:hypothetical protein